MNNHRLQQYFELSYASWLTLPRVLMEAMPDEWQNQMAALLEQYSDAFPNQPELWTRVQVIDARGRLVPTPDWLVNYRHPDLSAIDDLRRPSPPPSPPSWLPSPSRDS